MLREVCPVALACLLLPLSVVADAPMKGDNERSDRPPDASFVGEPDDKGSKADAMSSEAESEPSMPNDVSDESSSTADSISLLGLPEVDDFHRDPHNKEHALKKRTAKVEYEKGHLLVAEKNDYVTALSHLKEHSPMFDFPSFSLR